MRIEKGWLQAENQQEQDCLKHSCSDFFNERPPGEQINLLVIHNISLPPACFGGNQVEDLFLGCLNTDADERLKDLAGLEVSSHLFIRRDGLIQQFVAFDQRAWHAGKSEWKGKENCNDFSIGIEMEGADTVPYTSIQYQRLQTVTRLLMNHYQFSSEAIVGHEHIAPHRKTDPGMAFDWQYYKQGLV